MGRLMSTVAKPFSSLARRTRRPSGWRPGRPWRTAVGVRTPLPSGRRCRPTVGVPVTLSVVTRPFLSSVQRSLMTFWSRPCGSCGGSGSVDVHDVVEQQAGHLVAARVADEVGLRRPCRPGDAGAAGARLVDQDHAALGARLGQVSVMSVSMMTRSPLRAMFAVSSVLSVSCLWSGAGAGAAYSPPLVVLGPPEVGGDGLLDISYTGVGRPWKVRRRLALRRPCEVGAGGGLLARLVGLLGAGLAAIGAGLSVCLGAVGVGLPSGPRGRLAEIGVAAGGLLDPRRHGLGQVSTCLANASSAEGSLAVTNSAASVVGA
jgi:hypothetical protein